MNQPKSSRSLLAYLTGAFYEFFISIRRYTRTYSGVNIVFAGLVITIEFFTLSGVGDKIITLINDSNEKYGDIEFATSLFVGVIILFLFSIFFTHAIFFFIGRFFNKGWQKFVDYVYYILSLLGVCISLVGFEGSYLTFKAGYYLNNPDYISEFASAKIDLAAFFTPIVNSCADKLDWSGEFCHFADRANTALSKDLEITDDFSIESIFSIKSETSKLIQKFNNVINEKIKSRIKIYNYYAILKKYEHLEKNPLDRRFVFGLVLIILSVSIKISKCTVDILGWDRNSSD